MKPIEEISVAEWDEVIATHLRGAFLMTRAVLPEMYAKGGGAIVNISSIAARSAFPWGAAYATAKTGFWIDAHNSSEGAKRGVRVNAILPGPVAETEMWQELDRKLADRAGQRAPPCSKNVFARNFAGTSANRRRNCGGCGVSGVRSSQRDYWTGAERGRWNVFLLITSANTSPRRATGSAIEILFVWRGQPNKSRRQLPQTSETNRENKQRCCQFAETIKLRDNRHATATLSKFSMRDAETYQVLRFLRLN